VLQVCICGGGPAEQTPCPVQLFICQLPLELHVSMSMPQLPQATVWLSVGAHWPEQVPGATQVWWVHGAHMAPPMPHVPVPSRLKGTQLPLVPPLQQPPPQVFESQLHVPLVMSHRWFVQPPHIAPFVPHVPAPCDAHGTQLWPLQQPLGHEVESQTHDPPTHSPPVPHEVPFVTLLHPDVFVVGWQLWHELLALAVPAP